MPCRILTKSLYFLVLKKTESMKFHEMRPFGVALLRGDGRTDAHTQMIEPFFSLVLR